MRGRPRFSQEVFPKELEEVRRRRQSVSVDDSKLKDHDGPPDPELDLVGLALSGGGIRSATFSLGILQGLARLGILRRADYLSTVSGGGYTGSLLSSVLNDPELGDPYDAERGGRFPLQKELGSREPRLLNHLRNCSNYLIPRGVLSQLRLPTIVLRGLLLNLFLFAPMVMLAVEVTEVAYALATLKSSRRVTVSFVLIVLAVIFLLLVFTFPFISRLFRRKLGWSQRNTYDELLTASLALMLVSVVVLIVILTLNAAVTYPWTDIWFHLERLLSPLEPDGYWQPWALVLAALAALFLLSRASRDPSKLVSRVFLYTVGLLAPLILFAVYLALCVLEIDTPYLSKRVALDLNRAVEQSGHVDGTHIEHSANELLRAITSGEFEHEVRGMPTVISEFEHKGILLGSRPTVSVELDDAEQVERWLVKDSAGKEYAVRPLKNKLVIDEQEANLIDGPADYVFLGIWALLIVFNRFFLDVNTTSPHSFYRDRLSRPFLVKLNAGGEVEANDEIRLSELNAPGTSAPLHLINAALNLTASRDPTVRGRNADFFIFSKHYCGSYRTGYCSTQRMEQLDEHLNLGTAMAVSAAAAAPNMGTTTIKPLAFVMAMLNIRLGYWLPNPARAHLSALRLGGAGPTYLLREGLGLLDEEHNFVNLSDGGHLENLAVYELLRRRCRFIIAVDGEADPQMSFQSLNKLMRYAGIDMGIAFDIDLGGLYRGEGGASDAHCTLGEIRYGKDAEGNEVVGHLLYIKLSVTGDEPQYVQDYRARHPAFPHESTADQFFDESQFETYRALGEHITDGFDAEALGPFAELLQAPTAEPASWR